MKPIKVNWPLRQKIEIIVEISEYTKAMKFKVWLEHNSGFHSIYPDPEKCLYQFTINCDDFTDAAKLETFIQTEL